MSERPFYITTPIYYINDKPHLGTAYCTLMADTLARYHRLFGEATFFLTGTDEHGQKAQQAAEKKGVSPQQHADQMVVNFQEAWRALGVKNDIFFRTTSDLHREVVRGALQELWDAGDIYERDYEGWYCVSEEIFYTDKDLVNGKSPTGKEVVRLKEKSYFFKMSKYRERLIAHIQENPTFIQPDFRKNEVLGFLRQPLEDLCISRPKARLAWGIEIPFAPEYVTYVWFDALLNYATAVGYRQPARNADFKKWWYEGGACHLLGKDILTTHSVYWPTMLMALKLPLPRHIFATGWILNKDSAKMSKSEGHVVNPVELAAITGRDELRYFLAREIHLGNDAPFSLELLAARVNADLANNLGNLLSRTTNLVDKFFAGRKPALLPGDEASALLRARALELPTVVRKEIEAFRLSFALEQVVQVLSLANRYLEEKAPWKSAKSNLAEAGHVLATTLETLRVAGILLTPVLPDKAPELLHRIGCPASAKWSDLAQWPGIGEGATVAKGDPLFPRLELDQDKG